MSGSLQIPCHAGGPREWTQWYKPRLSGRNTWQARCCDINFFFQAEDGIRDYTVTGVQTCALPILSPLTGHAFLERRYLIIPGMRSSRIYIVDTKPDPTKAAIHKIIEPEEIFKKTGYSRPHTVHCGPEGIYVSTLGGGGKNGTDGPPGVFIMDCETFEVL